MVRIRIRGGSAWSATIVPFLVFLSYAVLDSLAGGVVGEAGPGWLEDEAGILATGVFWLGAGLWGRRSSRGEEQAPASLASGAA